MKFVTQNLTEKCYDRARNTVLSRRVSLMGVTKEQLSQINIHIGLIVVFGGNIPSTRNHYEVRTDLRRNKVYVYLTVDGNQSALFDDETLGYLNLAQDRNRFRGWTNKELEPHFDSVSQVTDDGDADEGPPTDCA